MSIGHSERILNELSKGSIKESMLGYIIPVNNNSSNMIVMERLTKLQKRVIQGKVRGSHKYWYEDGVKKLIKKKNTKLIPEDDYRAYPRFRIIVSNSGKITGSYGGSECISDKWINLITNHFYKPIEWVIANEHKCLSKDYTI